METISQKVLTGERALFCSSDLNIVDCVFDAGESPMKESKNLSLEHCLFRYKYPFWYCSDVTVRECTWFDMARAGVWYTSHMSVCDSIVEAPKNFRRCSDLTLKNVTFTNAAETLWHCDHVKIEDVSARGDYFFMNSSDAEISNLNLVGNYSFDGCKNLVVRNSRLISKDAFWNAENITVYDSFITGEYLGWNSRNITLINCTIESLQGMCYINNLVMKNCHLINTTLAFEYSSVEAEITGDATSILNPASGTIRAEHIGELILEPDRIDPSKTRIVCDCIEKQSERVVYPN